MIISLLVNSIASSALGRLFKKVSGSNLVSHMKDIIRESLTYKVILTIVITLNIAYNSSFLLRMRPQLCLLSRLKSETKGKIDKLMDFLSSPWLFPLTLLTFFWIAQLRPSPNTLLLLYLSALISSVSILLSKLDMKYIDVKNVRFVVMFTGIVMLFIGAIGFTMQIAKVRGLPLLNEELRRGLSPMLNYMAWTSVPGMAFLLSSLDNLSERRCLALILAALGFIPSLFLAFRTEMIAYVIAISVVLYSRRVIGGAHLLVGFIMALALFVGVGAIRSITTGVAAQPILSVLYRPTITVAALDTIVRRYNLYPVTHGLLHLAALSSLGLIRGSKYGPRTLISIYTLGRRDISTTATILGGPVLDGGLLGALLVVSLLSYMLGVSYRASKRAESMLGPYSTILAYTVVGVETGILDLNVYLYLIIAFIVTLTSLRPKGDQSG